jgi:hypothetical protein
VDNEEEIIIVKGNPHKNVSRARNKNVTEKNWIVNLECGAGGGGEKGPEERN